jgi:hypothetical protein
MKTLREKLTASKEKLEQQIENRHDTYANRSEKWQESEK